MRLICPLTFSWNEWRKIEFSQLSQAAFQASS